VDGQEVSWSERVQVLQSPSLLESQKAQLEKNLERAEQELWGLTVAGKGHRLWRDEAELREAVEALLAKYEVAELLQVSWQAEQSERQRHAGRGRPKKDAVAVVEVEIRYRISEVKRLAEKIAEKEKRLGWRAQVTNAPAEQLDLAGSVLTYREGGSEERVFHQLKDRPLGIRPLFVKRDEQIIGLTRLQLIALRVLTMVEVVVRGQLAKTGERLEGLYEGQASRKEAKPTATRLLKAIARLGVTLSCVAVAGESVWLLSPLPALLLRVLGLLGLPASLYTDLVPSEDTDQSASSMPPIALTG
jgi:transposase